MALYDGWWPVAWENPLRVRTLSITLAVRMAERVGSYGMLMCVILMVWLYLVLFKRTAVADILLLSLLWSVYWREFSASYCVAVLSGCLETCSNGWR